MPKNHIDDRNRSVAFGAATGAWTERVFAVGVPTNVASDRGTTLRVIRELGSAAGDTYPPVRAFTRSIS